jgi:transposase
MQIRMIGVDLAKHVFQVHGSDAEGNCLVKRRLRRNQMLEFFAGLAPCLVGMEACARLTTGRENCGRSGMMCA